MMGAKARTFGPIDHLTPEDLVLAAHFYRHVEPASISSGTCASASI